MPRLPPIRNLPLSEARKEKDFPDWRKAEGPLRLVEISRPFSLGVYEVAQAQYQLISTSQERCE
jgi:formylglycine-generating enzyme required for sulfatase activity